VFEEHHKPESEGTEQRQSEDENEKQPNGKQSGLIEKPRRKDVPGAIAWMPIFCSNGLGGLLSGKPQQGSMQM
jgi:hypothetical protein